MSSSFKNALANEKSPYLQQHAGNPVAWYPWSAEALARAKSDQKPIFLSIGYSTCHWCHVMAHESFENEETAKIMNENFINIKVDREERPDLDALYMTSVQMLTGAGGWPMSVWLTPDLKPFYGGTYFPPDDRYGRPSFGSVLTQLAEIWKTDREKIFHSSEQITDVLKQAASPQSGAGDLPGAAPTFEKAFTMLKKNHDPVNGGFGQAPKFPMPVYLDFLLAHHARTGNPQSLDMARFSMMKMAAGGIYDQLGGGFSRYSTDERWVVPHFEKMLYDNAQLTATAARLFQATKDSRIADLIHDTLRYILRDMTHPEGGFYSAEDADSEGKEGTFYLWTRAEISTVLGDQAGAFMERYGVTDNGNFFDPHTREVGQNILVQAVPDPDLADAKRMLFEVRSKRPRPHLDDKIISGWNGLMISGFARASLALADDRYLAAANRAANFLKNHLWDAAEKRLYRRWRDGERGIGAFQSDYAELTQGLLDLFEAGGDGAVLDWAVRLQEVQDDLFWDEDGGGYYLSTPSSDVLVRTKEDHDNVIPSGNSLAALNGLRLTELTTNPAFDAKARRTLQAFASTLAQQPPSLMKMVVALDWAENGSTQVVIVGKKESPEMKALVKAAASVFQPGLSLVQIDVLQDRALIGKLLPYTSNMNAVNGQATAYVCVGHACQQPTQDASDLVRQLTAPAANLRPN